MHIAHLQLLMPGSGDFCPEPGWHPPSWSWPCGKGRWSLIRLPTGRCPCRCPLPPQPLHARYLKQHHLTSMENSSSPGCHPALSGVYCPLVSSSRPVAGDRAAERACLWVLIAPSSEHRPGGTGKQSAWLGPLLPAPSLHHVSSVSSVPGAQQVGHLPVLCLRSRLAVSGLGGR